MRNARVTISNKDNGTTQSVDTGSTGAFSVGNLAPGTYVVRVEAKNFKTFQSTLPVQVGQMASVNAKLELGDLVNA